MYYVYFLKSIKQGRLYIGYTNDLKRRLEEHNAGQSTYTNKYKPWKVETYVTTEYEHTAKLVEKYFKSNSGKEAVKRHVEKKPAYNNLTTYFETLELGKKFSRSKFYLSHRTDKGECVFKSADAMEF